MNEEQLKVSENTRVFLEVGPWRLIVEIGESGHLCLSVDEPGKPSDACHTLDVNVYPDLSVTSG